MRWIEADYGLGRLCQPDYAEATVVYGEDDVHIDIYAQCEEPEEPSHLKMHNVNFMAAN